MCWGSHILFQSPNGAHVLWPTLSRRFFFFFSRAQMNFRRSWNRINLSRPMNNKGMKMLGLVVWEQRMWRPLWEIHLWSCSDALNANYETQKRSETKRHATDSAIHHAMLFDLKRLFFSLIIFAIVGAVLPQEKIRCRLSVPPSCFTGRSEVRGSVPCSQALPQERDFPHEGRLPKATILPFFFFFFHGNLFDL